MKPRPSYLVHRVTEMVDTIETVIEYDLDHREDPKPPYITEIQNHLIHVTRYLKAIREFAENNGL